MGSPGKGVSSTGATEQIRFVMVFGVFLCSWCLPRVFFGVFLFWFVVCFVFLALLSEALGQIETTPIKFV